MDDAYQVAELVSPLGQWLLDINSVEARPHVGRHIEQVMDIESPVHIDVLIDRLRSPWRIQSATQRVRRPCDGLSRNEWYAVSFRNMVTGFCGRRARELSRFACRYVVTRERSAALQRYRYRRLGSPFGTSWIQPETPQPTSYLQPRHVYLAGAGEARIYRPASTRL